MTIDELRARLREVNAAANAIITTADTEADGELTDEQSVQLDAHFAEAEQLTQKIEVREQLARQTAAVSAMDQPRGRAAQPPELTGRIEPGRDDGAVERSGFRNLADFAVSVHAASMPGGGGPIDQRLVTMRDAAMQDIQAAPSNFHQETGSADGYMVPPAFRREIWDLVFNDDGLLSTVDSEPTASNQVDFVADESTPWGSTGVQAHWRSEGAQMSASKLATAGRSMRLHELYAFVLATEELLQDAPRLNNRLTTKAAQAIRWKADEALIYGDGVGKPLGWFTSGAKVTVAKVASQTAATIVTKNVSTMFSRLLPAGLGRAYWLANSDTLPQLMELLIGDQPVWTPPDRGFQQAPGGFLLGRPIRFSEHANTLGAEGDLQLVDPMGYYAATKQGGIDFAASIHLYFDYNMQAFRWVFRLGGQPYLSAPVSPAKGSATKSHFVTLAVRA